MIGMAFKRPLLSGAGEPRKEDREEIKALSWKENEKGK